MARTELCRTRRVLVYAAALFLPVATWAAHQIRVGSSEPRTPTNVAWTDETIREASGGDALRGLLISRRCERCHGQEGFSPSPSIPNLAGMDQLVTWKQLEDFRSGKRDSGVMRKIASDLSPRDSADLAAYYHLLPSSADPQDNRAFPEAISDPALIPIAARLISLGDGRRGVPPCQACHGPVAYVTGAPSLSAQNSDYILRELNGFADESRTNDINVRMRSIAQELTVDERRALSEYYGAGRGSSPAAAAITR